MRWFIFLKSYGDFIIACNYLRFENNNDYKLLCGNHLKSLSNAVGYEGSVVWIETGNSGVPAFFDIRKSGFCAGMMSGLKLHNQINNCISVNDQLIFDKLGWRNNFLAGRMSTTQIATTDTNIYLDYERFLNFRTNNDNNKIIKKIPKIGIFPDSRMTVKKINNELVSEIYNQLIKIDCDPQLVYITTNSFNSSLNFRCINGFDALVESIRNFDLIISADSLPAHLAEYFGLPVFVFSPIPNHYWLPKSAYVHNRFSLFNDKFKYLEWVSNMKENFY
jgi:hypothetical protein